MLAHVRMNDQAKKILICDDDDTLLGLIEAILQGAGYDVVTAEDGFECLDRFSAERPDMLIIDIDMPNKNGFEVLEELTRAGSLGRMPLFVLSGRERKEDLERAQSFGARGFIVKPFSGDVLIGKVKEAFAS